MTKEITKSIILQEMQDKFGLREFAPANFLFEETVVPVYDIQKHLVTPENMAATKSITASGSYIFFSVPADEKWVLNGYTIIFVTGAFTVAGALLGRTSIDSSYLYLDLSAAISTSYTHLLPNPIVLFPSEKLGINVDGYTSTGDLLMRIDVIVEKTR